MNIDKLSLEEKIGQMLCFAFHGTSINEDLRTIISEKKLGNVVLFARNIESINQVKKLNEDLQSLSKIPLFISLDQEGGMVRRVIEDITYLPGAMSMAASSTDKIYELNYSLARNLKSLGFNVNYAPVADINNNPNNPVINSRSFGDNPNNVASCLIKAFTASQEALVLPTVKHFPGHGDTAVDSHLGLPIVDKSLEEITSLELVPYIKAIENGLEGVMISHILYNQIDREYPSSLSYNIITRLLKEKLGFKGLITTDSLTMAAIWSKFSIEEIVLNGVNAGNDILVFCGGAETEVQLKIIETFKKLVLDGKIKIERVNESVEKILKLKEKYAKINNDDIIINIDSFQTLKNSITKVKDNNLLPIKKDEKVLVIFPKINLASLVDNENNKYESLSKYLNSEEIIVDENFDDYKILVQKALVYDKIIMATYNVKKNDFQSKIFDLLDKTKTIVVALRSPYDILNLNGVLSYLCTYEATKESIKALSQKLLENNFSGKLPINL